MSTGQENEMPISPRGQGNRTDQKKPIPSSLTTPPPLTRFNSTVINNTTINNTNINITINTPAHSSHDLITDAISNAINEVMNSSTPTSPDPSSAPYQPPSSAESEKLEMLKKRLAMVNSDACEIMKHMLVLALDETTDHQTLMEMAKLVMSMKQNVS
jgi:hypothetical protein